MNSEFSYSQTEVTEKNLYDALQLAQDSFSNLDDLVREHGNKTHEKALYKDLYSVIFRLTLILGVAGIDRQQKIADRNKHEGELYFQQKIADLKKCETKSSEFIFFKYNRQQFSQTPNSLKDYKRIVSFDTNARSLQEVLDKIYNKELDISVSLQERDLILIPDFYGFYYRIVKNGFQLNVNRDGILTPL